MALDQDLLFTTECTYCLLPDSRGHS
jgi:hypothetical protein